MRRLAPRLRYAWWKLVLFRFVLYSIAANGQLALSSANLNFGAVQVANSRTLSVTVSNSGKSNLTISQANVSGTGFSFVGPGLPITLGPQQAATLSVTFAPQAGGSISGSMSLASLNPVGNSGKQHSSNTRITLSGTGISLTAAAAPGYLAPNPASVSFGSIQVGSNQTQYVALTNSGASTVTISQATINGTGFTLSGFNSSETLAQGQSLTLTIVFAPTASGNKNGTLTFMSDASDGNLTVALSGNGVSAGQLSISPGSMSFGTVAVGTTQQQTGTLSVTGSSVTVSSSSSSSAEFTLTGVTLPLTLAAGQSVPFAVTFAPQISGTASANISFASNASAPSITGIVTGTGATPVQHSVDLSWDPSASTVIGYNVYRAAISGGPYTKVNSSPNASINYTDNTVQSGQTYFYVITSLGSTGVESGYSNQVSAVVPLS